MKNKSKYVIKIANSQDAYARLKPITDAAQAGILKPWSPEVIDLLGSYNINVQRLKDIKAEANLSFPTSIKNNKSMAIGFRYLKEDDSSAEDIFIFEENVGLTCYYRGSQEKELPEYTGTHHAPIKLKEVLPDFQRELSDMQQQINSVSSAAGVEQITDEMHQQAMQTVMVNFHIKVQAFRNAHGSSSAVQQYSMVAHKEATRERKALMAKKALSDKIYHDASPELTMIIRAQANTNRFEVKLVNNSSQTLVANNLSINGVDTPLNQQFKKLFPIEEVSIPKDIFDKKTDEVVVTVSYSTLDQKKYEYTQIGTQQYRKGDKRYNVVFAVPGSSKPILG